MTGPGGARRVLFADLDGTVRHGYDELGRFVNTAADVVIFPEALTRIRAWRAAGGLVIGVTNQGGVGLGYLDADEHERIMTETQFSAELDDVVACVHRPDAGCWCRKPLPGLIFRALDRLAGAPGLCPVRSSCLMVGDRDEDREAAAAAGVPFLDAASWRAGTWDGGDAS